MNEHRLIRLTGRPASETENELNTLSAEGWSIAHVIQATQGEHEWTDAQALLEHPILGEISVW